MERKVMKEEKCPICNQLSSKLGWIAYCFVSDEGYERTTIDYCCHDCISRIKTEINYRQLQHKGTIENIGNVQIKGKVIH